MKHQLLLILPVFFLLSCASNKMKHSYDHIDISDKNFMLLKGKYAIDNSNDVNFLSKLKGKINPGSYAVELIPNNQNSILVNIFSNDSLVNSYKLKGRYRSGYFQTNKETGVASVFAGPLFWLSDEGRPTLALQMKIICV